MENLCLSLYEWDYLGSVRKAPIPAIPDAYKSLPRDVAGELRQAAMDSLLARGLICMDFDGEISLSAAAQERLRICLDCDGYYLVSLYRTDGTRREELIWKKGKEFLRAEITGTNYTLSRVSAEEIRTTVQCLADSRITVDHGEASIQLTQYVLKKAKNAIKQGNQAHAARLLLPGGGNMELAAAVLDALSGRADLLIAACVELRKADANATHLISIGQYGYLEVLPTVEDYRSAAVFSYADGEELRSRLMQEVDAFVSES